MKEDTKKKRYKGYSLGSSYYRYASSVKQAKGLLRKAALDAVGKYDFNFVGVETFPGSNLYSKIATCIL